MKLPEAEEINYWKTSKSSVSSWLDKTENMILHFGGSVSLVARGSMQNHRAFLIEFTHQNDSYRILFPVLKTNTNDIRAAERQAATLIYHDVKARLLRAKLFGIKNAFFEYLLLPDKRTVGELTVPDLINYNPKRLQ